MTTCDVCAVSDKDAESLQRQNAGSSMIVLDSGDSAKLVVVSCDEGVGRGSRFRYRGRWWVVTGDRRDSGVAVAEPSLC